MKFVGGSIWRGIRGSKMPLRLLGYLMIVPALLGLIVAPSAVIWMPAWNWRGTLSISLGFCLSTILAIRSLSGFTRNARASKTIDVEEFCSTLGFMIAFFVGAYAFGLNPLKWDQARPRRGAVSDEHAPRTTAGSNPVDVRTRIHFIKAIEASDPGALTCHSFDELIPSQNLEIRLCGFPVRQGQQKRSGRLRRLSHF
ncbi:MAG: hypothetical protein MUF31_09870 [Akkermansiaceae bacterium]|nr:hypothetical protein [Akkermansiaceae bacterium]